MGEVKGQSHIVHLVSNRCTSFSLHINWTNHSLDMSNRVFDLEKKTSEILKGNLQKKGFQENDQRNIATKFCNDWMSGSHSILQTRNFCLSMSQSRHWVKVTKRSSSIYISRPILSLSQISKV